MVVTASGVHQTIFAYVANTMQFQATSQIKFAVNARKSDAHVLAVALAKEMKCASAMEPTDKIRKVGVDSVLLLGLVQLVESVLVRHRRCRRTQHVLIVYMMFSLCRHICYVTLYMPFISRTLVKKFMRAAWKHFHP